MIALLIAQLISSAPPLSPAAAAQVLARLDSPSNVATRFICTDCDGPRVIVTFGDPAAGPFGAFPAYPIQRPLNCCSVYRVRLPRPTPGPRSRR